MGGLTDPADDGPRLRRSIGPLTLTFYGLGNILGAGIYALIGEVAAAAGYHTYLAFLVASLAAAFTALSYAELSARYPHSAGEAVYLQRGFDRVWLSRLVGLLITLAGIVSAGTIARAFAGYLQVLLPVNEQVAIAVVVLALGALAAWGVRQSVGAAALVTAVELVGLALILWVATGAPAADPGWSAATLQRPQAGMWSGIVVGAFLAFYAFIGFEDIVNIAEEVRDPQRSLPLAIVMALVVATVLYVAVAVAAVRVVPPGELGGASAPLALVYRAATGGSAEVIALISLFAVINGALIQIIMSSRLLYGMAREGWVPVGLARVERATRTPVMAIALVTVTVMVLALAVPMVGLAAATSTLVLVVFTLVNLALLRIKHREPRPAGVRVFPFWVPALGMGSSVALLAARFAVG